MLWWMFMNKTEREKNKLKRKICGVHEAEPLTTINKFMHTLIMKYANEPVSDETLHKIRDDVSEYLTPNLEEFEIQFYGVDWYGGNRILLKIKFNFHLHWIYFY